MRRIYQLARSSGHGVSECSKNSPVFCRNFTAAYLRANCQTQIRNEHGPRQLIATQNPVEPFDDGTLSFRHPVPFRDLQERRSHAILMNRIDFVEIENASSHG